MDFSLDSSSDQLADLWKNLQLVMPEIWLIIAMCAVILVPFVRRNSFTLPLVTTMIGLGAALAYVIPTLGSNTDQPSIVFFGMLAIDPFSQVFKIILIVFTLFVVVQWMIVSRDQTNVLDVPDFMCLLLGAVAGMALMASATNLLMIVIATELASLPSFALAGFRKHHARSCEGSLKYVVFGAASSAAMIYGMSLIYGATGSLGLAEVSRAAGDGTSLMFAVGMLAMFAGLAFKLSAVPFHFWCPDVFEGAPIEVTTFLSVASKGAAVCLLVRVVGNMALGTGLVGHPGLMVGVAILGVVTATWGNLAALRQTNIKRLLAYSSIAHSGYMIMTVSVIAVAGGPGGVKYVAGVILFYLLIYTFMNLGAFTVAALIAGATGSEQISDYAGLSRRSPRLALLLTLFLLSLFGLPGLGGFMGKVFLMTAMLKAGEVNPQYVPVVTLLIGFLLVNTLLSLYYYMRPIVFTYLVRDTEDRPSFLPQLPATVMLAFCAIVLVITGVLPNLVVEMTSPYGTIAWLNEISTQTAITTVP